MAKTEHITTDNLRSLDAFAELSNAAIDWLLSAGQLRQLPARERLSALPQPPIEAYYFLLRGVMAITLEAGTIQVPPLARPSKRPPKEQQYLGFFEAGACFSGAFLGEQSVLSSMRVDCVASNDVTLLEIPQQYLSDLLATQPEWKARLASSVAHSRDFFLTHQEPNRRVVQDFFLRENYVTSSLVRVGQLDRCLYCNKCHDACAERHGAPRMTRFGPTLGKLSFPIVCRTCHDQPCVSACSFGGIALDEASGDIHISDRCAGCGACAERCPNDAITIIRRPYTVADFPDPMPFSDLGGMTNVGNLLVAGDVSGAALIRLAINEAVRAVDRISERKPGLDERVFDVAIVGGGPAGLAAALRCRERKLTYWVIEKDRLGSTIRDYPKNKHVMAEPSNVPLNSSLWFEDCTKEELLARWQQLVIEEQIQILEQTEVKQIEKSDGLFTLHTDRGNIVAEHVVVCIGKRGSPRRLGVPGESHPRVRYLLTDPDEHAGQHVVVVGGGDSAIEAALSLADVSGTTVTLSYRQGAFSRAKALNRKRLEEYQAAGKVQVELKSTVVALTPGSLQLKTESGELALTNDVVFALLGADPPTRFLKDAGIQVLEPGSKEMTDFAATRGERQRAVKCDHCAGFADRACMTACPTGALIEIQTDDLFRTNEVSLPTHSRPFSDAQFLRGSTDALAMQQGSHRWKAAVTTVTLVLLAAIGVESFLIRTQPENSLLHYVTQATGSTFPVSFTSGRGIGHWLGYIGATSMFLSVFYSLRTRVKRFKRLGSQTGWLSAHVWLGFTGATLVTYHSALKLDRWAGIACVLMWLVLVTGGVGRYAYGRVHSATSLAEFELDALRTRCKAFAERCATSASVRLLLGSDSLEGRKRWSLGVMLWEEVRDRVLLGWLFAFGTGHLSSKQERRDMRNSFSSWTAHRRRSSYYQSAQSILKHWNIIHIVLTILMFVLAGIHIFYGFVYKAV